SKELPGLTRQVKPDFMRERIGIRIGYFKYSTPILTNQPDIFFQFPSVKNLRGQVHRKPDQFPVDFIAGHMIKDEIKVRPCGQSMRLSPGYPYDLERLSIHTVILRIDRYSPRFYGYPVGFVIVLQRKLHRFHRSG